MPRIGVREWLAVGRVIAHGDLLRTSSRLDVCGRFERDLAKAMGTSHALAVNSGTAALISALQACDIGPGDEVLVSAYTWMASAAAVLHVGAVPVLVEVDATLTMDPEDLSARITPRSRAVIPVHMINRPCDMDPILRIASDHDLRVIEDACQAIGVRYKGRACGTMGDAGAFSFNQMKNMTCGEGGAVLTSDPRLHARAVCAHDLGLSFRAVAPELGEDGFVGSNFRISEIEGAILSVQLSRLHGRMQRLQRRAALLERMCRDAGLPVAPQTHSGPPMGVAITFDKVEEAVAMAHVPGARRLFDTSKHVYTEWTTILARRMAHPRIDPWADAPGSTPITRDSCPRTLDLLQRTCALNLRVDWPMPMARMSFDRMLQAYGAGRSR